MKEQNIQNDYENNQIGLLGDYLKQNRLDNNFTLEKLSQKTKISVNILKSLESNDFKHLPSAAYIKGFVISYVKVLGIPHDEAINKMEYTYLTLLGKPFPALNHTKQMTSTTGKSDQALAEPSPQEVIESSDSIIENTKSALPFVIFMVVILVFIGGYKLISTVVENEVNNQKNTDLGPRIESSSALVNVKAPPKPVNEQATETSNASQSVETPKEEPVKLTEFERNFPAIEFKKIKGKLFNVITDSPDNDNTELLPEKIKSSMNSSIQNIYIRAIEGNTWVSYKIDANPINSVIISKDGELFLQGSDIRLFLGNVNVTKIFYNNYLIETPTKSGVKSLVFPEENNSKYQMPLFPKAKDDILYTSEEYQKRMKMEEEELEKRKQ